MSTNDPDPIAEMRAAVRRLSDERDIRAVLTRYCRGIDRSDHELVLSCFYDDAQIDYGNLVGAPTIIVDPPRRTPAMHLIGNMHIQIDGDRAVSETYFVSFQKVTEHGRPMTRTRGARYVDGFERRGETWRIARRLLIDDWSRLDPVVATVEQVGGNPGQRSDQDPSYALFAQWLGAGRASG